jgi:hypothetical protein
VRHAATVCAPFYDEPASIRQRDRPLGLLDIFGKNHDRDQSFFRFAQGSDNCIVNHQQQARL